MSTGNIFPLSYLLEKKGLRKNELAAALGVQPRTVYNWTQLDGLQKASARDVARLADYFGCDVDFLLGRQPEPQKALADVSQQVGLSYEAVAVLQKINEASPILIDVLSQMVIDEDFLSLLELFADYVEAADTIETARGFHTTVSNHRTANIRSEIFVVIADILKRSKTALFGHLEREKGAFELAKMLSEVLKNGSTTIEGAKETYDALNLGAYGISFGGVLGNAETSKR